MRKIGKRKKKNSEYCNKNNKKSKEYKKQMEIYNNKN